MSDDGPRQEDWLWREREDGPERPGWQPPAPAEPAAARPSGPPPAGLRRTPGSATAALVLGILGMVVCPVVCSVLAIVLGVQARNEIDRDPSLGGRSSAQAGFVLGIVGLSMSALFLLAILAGGLTL